MSSGLADYIVYDPCPCPADAAYWASIPPGQLPPPPVGWASQTVDPSIVAEAAILNAAAAQKAQGMGDYLSGFAYPVPQRLTPGGGGLGDIALVSPEGFFQGTVDEWGIAEWGSILLGIYALGSLIGDAKRTGRRTKKAYRAFRSKTA